MVWQALSTGDPVVGGVVYDNEYVLDIVPSCIISFNTNNISMIISMHFSGCPLSMDMEWDVKIARRKFEVQVEGLDINLSVSMNSLKIFE